MEIEPLYERERLSLVPVEKAQFNFAITHPGEGWKGVRARRLHPLGAVAFEKGDAEMFCVVVPLAVGEADLNHPLARKIFTDTLLATMAETGAIDEHRESDEVLNGVNFIRAEIVYRPPFSGMPLRYEYWIATHQGMSWQILVWTRPERKEELAREGRRLVSGFRILDPSRSTRQLAGAVLQDVNRPELGYRTDFQGAGWRGVNDRSSFSPLVDFIAERPGAGVTVTALRFEDGESLPDQEALIRGLLATAGFDYPQGANFSVSPYGEGGSEISVKREAQDFTAQYLMRVVRGKNVAHLVTGWVMLNPQTVDMSHLRDGMDCVLLTETAKGTLPKPSAWQKGELAAVFNQIGLSCYQAKNFTHASHWCQRAFRLDEANAVILQNAVMALEGAGKKEEALALVRQQKDKFKESPALAAQMGLIAARNGEVDEAAAAYLKLLETGYNDEASLLEWIGILLQRDQAKLALKMTETYAAKHPTHKAQQWLAELVMSNEDGARAVQILDKLAKNTPDDEYTLVLLGEASNMTEDYPRAGEIAEKLLAGGHKEVRVLMMQGWSHVGRKRYKEAKACFEEVARLAPDHREVQKAITIASTLLGQGSNSDLKQVVQPVPLPPELRKALEARGKVAPDFGKGHGLVYELRAVGFFHEPGKPRRSTEHRRVRILTKEGAESFSTVEMPFDPVYERMHVNRVEVWDPSGKPVPQAGLDAAYVRDLQDGGIADQKKVLHLQIAGVTPGCTVEYEISQEDRNADQEFRFERRPLGHYFPVVCDAVYVTGAPEKVRHHLLNGQAVETLKSPGQVVWLAVQPPLLKPEPLAAPLDRYAPVVCLGGEDKDWSTVGREYLKEIEDRIQPDPAARELAGKVTAGLPSERAKVEALTRYVQRELNYKAIEFGVRARRPNTAAESISHHYGDCKDHSLLLQQLLAAAGVPSHLVLLHQEWKTVSELPTLDQFNHMIVYVPSLGAHGFVDATEKYLDATSYPPMAVWRNRPFVLDPANPCLLEVKQPTSTAIGVESQRSVSLKGSDDLRVEEVVTFKGYSASAMRGSLTSIEPSRQLQAVQSYLSRLGPIEVEDFQFENVDAFHLPAIFRLTYTVRNAVNETDGKKSFALPAFWERNYLETTFVKDRSTPFEFLLPTLITSEVKLHLPHDLTPATAGQFKAKGQGSYNRWETSFTPAPGPDGVNVVRYRFQSDFSEGKASQYQGFHDAWRSALSPWNKPVEWQEK